MQELHVTNAPKSTTFQMRINPDIKARVEEIYSNCGMTLTDAINAFLQQSINVGGLPFLVTQNSKQALRRQAIDLLMAELASGDDEKGSVSLKEAAKEFGIDL